MSEAPLETVAIIGISCRFPGANGVEEFWRNLRDGVESITSFTTEELEELGRPPAEVRAANYVKAAPILACDPGMFDARFFGLSPREAELADPQHRLLFECAWEALEAAGYDPPQTGERVAVFAGASVSNYALSRVIGNPGLGNVDGLQVLTGIDKDYLASRTSFLLDLRGPSVAVQTACSSSLVAVYLACESLASYSCDMALAGGTSVGVPQRQGYFAIDGGVRSPDGHCRPYSAGSNGAVFGSGVGAVLLKRTEDALADGDRILAVIRGAAINNDGALKAGFTAPSVQGQAEVIASALAVAGVEPGSIDYVEGHGTGTALGDPIEVSALAEAFRVRGGRRDRCLLGSVKSNIGHLDAAAGMAGLIKTVLAMNHGEIPGTVHFERPNPRIDFEQAPFRVSGKLEPWPEGGAAPRRAGVSSFGIGGTNAHLVLEEAPPAEFQGGPPRSHQLLVLSARSAAALETATARLAAHLRRFPETDLADAAFTLQVGRRAFEHRRIAVCRDGEDAAAVLEGAAPKRLLSDVVEPGERAVAFLFPGQGAQFVDMGRQLYAEEEPFRRELERCAEVLRPHLEVDLLELLFPPPEEASAAAGRLARTDLTQPAVFAVSYATARLWMAWGVEPQAMLGHSIGEYVAACLAETLSLEDALALVAARGRLIAELPPGAMLSVPLAEDELTPRLGPELAVAALNGPALSVVSGPEAAVEKLRAELAAEEVETRRLHTSHAFHSPMMEPMIEPFLRTLGGVTLRAPTRPWVSGTTGEWITAAEATDPRYWARHCREPVRFADGLERLFAEPNRVLLEVGPGRALSRLARRHPEWSPQRPVLASMRAPQSEESEGEVLLAAAGGLWLSGVAIDWRRVHAGRPRRRVDLPTYPFERQLYWLDKPPAAAEEARAAKLDLADWFEIPAWRRTLPRRAATLGDPGRRWLVLRDVGTLDGTAPDGTAVGLGAAVVERLTAAGEAVVTVTIGEAFSAPGEGTFTVAPDRREDWDALVAALREDDLLPDAIVHLWGVGEAGVGGGGIAQDGGAEDGAADEAFTVRGFLSLLYLTQALCEGRMETPPRLAVVADGLWRVAHGDLPRPAKSLVLGPALTLPHEYRGVACCVVDVAPPRGPAGSGALARLAGRILAELLADDARAAVALRGDQRWERSLEPVPLAGPADRPRGLRQQGVYLITGGLGGLGLTLAEALAGSVGARLVLTGRSALPEERWDAWLEEHGDDDPQSVRIHRLRALEAAGAEVMVAAAEVSDAERMEAVVAAAVERFGTIHGAVHAAGVTGGSILQFLDREAAETVMAPKVTGTRVLAEALAGLELDFLMLFSSTLSLTGGAGIADYRAANAFLDAFAQARAAGEGPPVLAVHWDLWSEVGMGADIARRLGGDAEPEAAAADPEARAISPEEGAALFLRLLDGGLEAGEIVVSPRDLRAQLNAPAVLPPPPEDELPPGGRERPALRTPHVAPRNEIEVAIAELWGELLGFSGLGVHDDFFELGGHSLVGVQMVNRMRATFEIDLPLDAFFEAPTVAELAEKVMASLTDEVDESELLAALAEVEEEEVG